MSYDVASKARRVHNSFMTDSNELAKKRTDWAEDRTMLANERTFSSWMGTGLGTVAIAIGLKAVFGAADPTWVAKALASMFLAVAILIYWLAQRQACRTHARHRQGHELHRR